MRKIVYTEIEERICVWITEIAEEPANEKEISIMEKGQPPRLFQEFNVLQNRPPEVRYSIDLGTVNLLDVDMRRTVDGLENTAIMLVPPKGCGYRCDFCSIKDIANPDFPVATEQGGVEAAESVAREIDAFLQVHPEAQTLKLFNAGNILYGTERTRSGELHEAFWPFLIGRLQKHETLKVLEIEVRIDEFIGSNKNRNGQLTPKGVLRERITALAAQLSKIGKSLRCILPLEYVESSIISQQSKFAQVFASEGKNKENCEQAISFIQQHGIELLSYAMLGGRLKDRPLSEEEAIASAAHTTLFGLEHGAREVIINSQYLDPINLWEQERDSVKYYVPTERAMIGTLRLIVFGLDKISKVQDRIPRVRLTTDKENVIEGTVGPDVSQEFRQLILDFNNALEQAAFFQTEMEHMRFTDEGKQVIS